MMLNMTTSSAVSGLYEYHNLGSEYHNLGKELSWKMNDQLANKEGFRHNVYWVTGDLYRGYWSHNKREGNGIHTYRNGDRYEGQWKNGRKEGQGTFWIAVDGKYKALYRGSWQAGKWHGKGILYSDRGETYEGEFENGERCGTGKQTYWRNDLDAYEVYVGQWLHNKREGSGVFYMVNGDRYEGSYKNDMKNGKGILFYRDGCSRYEGLWHANVPVCGTYVRLDKEHAHELPLLEVKNSETLAADIISESISKIEAQNNSMNSETLAADNQWIHLKDRTSKSEYGLTKP